MGGPVLLIGLIVLFFALSLGGEALAHWLGEKVRKLPAKRRKAIHLSVLGVAIVILVWGKATGRLELW